MEEESVDYGAVAAPTRDESLALSNGVELCREQFVTLSGDVVVARSNLSMSTEDQAAIVSALRRAARDPAAKVKQLEWLPITDGSIDVHASTPIGIYTISVDSPFAGATHYLWIAGQVDDSDHHSEHRTMASAKAAALADYERRTKYAPDAALPDGEIRR